MGGRNIAARRRRNARATADREETKKLEAYIRRVLGNPRIRLTRVAPDAEVHLGDEFLGVVFPDDHKEGRTFYFEMAIFEDEIEVLPPPRRLR